MDHQDLSGQIIRLFEQFFAAMYVDAIHDVATKYQETRALYNAREYANIMHAHIRHHAKRQFRGKPGVDFVDNNSEAFCIIIDGQHYGIPTVVVIKLKKLDAKKLLSANIPTNTVIRFNNQRLAPPPPPKIAVQFGLWGNHKTIIIADHTASLIVGYVPNALWTGLDKVAATYPTGLRSAQLLLEVQLNTAENTAEIVQMPAAEVVESGPRKRVRARRKSAEQDEKPDKKRVQSELNKKSKVVEFKKRSVNDESSS